MTRTGEVTEVKNEAIRVTFCRPEACAQCGGCDGNKKETSIWIRGQAEKGDLAIVDMPERIVASASFMAYLMPLCLFVFGMLAGDAFSGHNEAVTAVCGLVGLLVALVLLKVTEQKRKNKTEWSPVLVEIIPHK